MSVPAHKDAKRKFSLIDARPFYFPIGLSLTLHALVFWSAHEVSPSRDASASRQHELRGSLQQTPTAAPIEKPLLKPAASTETGSVHQPEKSIKPQPDIRRAPDGITKTPLAQKQAEALPNLPSEPIQSSVDQTGLRQYYLALARQAQQFRRYPEEARAAGWQGSVTMRLVVSDAGSPLGVSLVDSSGFPVLDQEALDMTLLSARHTEVPESLRGRAFSIDVAIDYSLDETP
ncbi:MAG: energy transducer TonB [Dechloromonas sp.]|nr:energy transducer TonB [Dechloromonas sp.]